MKKNKKILLIVVIIVILTLLGGLLYFLIGSKDKNSNVDDDSSQVQVQTTAKLKIVNPDTTSRPYAIMINNHGTARPLQSGLQDAYIIYEMIVEGGLTRYMALFLDQNTERIGSIRSARHYFLDYALENDAIYVHHGNSPQAKSDFSTLGIDRIEVSNSTGWRDTDLRKQGIAYEHTLFTSIDKLSNGLSGKRTERNNNLLLDYSVDELDLATYDGAVSANSVSIKYSSSVVSSYEYDAENKVYKRFVNGKEHTDYVTGDQYTFKNIITYQVANSTIEGDKKGRQTLSNIGSGSGYYISDGYAVPITWEKTSRSSQTVYKFLNGETIVVNDGNTFIQIQPKGQELTIE
jgi:hypothetical protein